MSADWGWSPMFNQCFKVHRATAVTSTHSCHRLILACPSEPSRAGREERTPTLCRAGHHIGIPVSAQGRRCGTASGGCWQRCSAGTPLCPSSLTLTSISLRMTSMMLPITMRKSKTFQGSPK